VLWNIPYFWTVKVGITGDLKQRQRDIDRTNEGIDLRVFWLRIPFAYQVEQWVHEKMNWAKVGGFSGSGHTERFLFPAIFPAIFGALFVFIIKWIIIFSIAFLIGWAIINIQ